ncbi:MAG: PKD domain-containing protein [Bacteroidia bacterium]
MKKEITYFDYAIFIRIRTILLLVFLFLIKTSDAQIIASDSSGCAPLVGVVFTPPAGATTFNWTFGDGAGSPLASPTHTYSSAGIYTVIFTGLVGGNSVTDSLHISVFGKPSAYFTSSSVLSGCVPLNVIFNDSSFGGGGTAITKWEWAFGDGGVNTANNPNPLYTYTVGGSFTVTLKVTDANGCDSSYARLNYVNTSTQPTIIITTNPSPPVACLPPLNVTFSASNCVSHSTTGTGLTYFWNFGGGDTSIVVNPPVKTYNTQGTFPVSLVVTDNNGCSNSTSINVLVNNPLASFYAVGAVNDTVCEWVTFHNQSTGANPVYTYGDGTTGIDSTHHYTTPGVYHVNLHVISGPCADDSLITIVVEDIQALFTSTPTYSCSFPFTVQFTNQSINGVSYQWIFGDGLLSPSTNPIHSFLQPDTNQYTIYPEWYFTDTLIATSIHGCKDTLSKFRNDTVFKPTALFMPDKVNGCAPLTVTFSDSSLSKETIVNWFWNYGDGNTHNGTDTIVTHTFTNPGIYNVTLIITNSKGCKDTSFAITIYVGDPPVPNFSVIPTVICADQPVQFTDLTPAGDSSQYWHYTTDGGFMSHCFNDPNPVWYFNNVVGPQSVTLTTTYNGCSGSTTIPNAITIKGPIARFYPQGDCSTPFTYIFHSDIKDATSWTWDFGDGIIINTSTDTAPSHTYTVTGDYTVILTAQNNITGCPAYDDSAVVRVRNIKSSFTSDSIFCARDSIVFDGGLSQDAYGHCHEGYLWYWGDGTHPDNTENPTFYHAFANNGIFQVLLIAKDANGCVDSSINAVHVYDIQANIKPDKLIGCLPLTVNFTDSTLADTTIVSWSWSFGDGGTSTLQNPSHTFTIPAVHYIISLTVTDILGCTSIKTLFITPSIPDSLFTAQTSVNICVGDSVRFLPHGSNLIYSWSFGDGGTSTVYYPYHTYNTAGLYTVNLIVTDSIGCQSSRTIYNLVNVQDYPTAGFYSSADTLLNKCYPLLVNFTDTSIVNVFGVRFWNLGNGTSSVGSQTVGTLYQAPGTYNITLIEVTSNGCRDTVTKSITVEGPEGDFTIVPDTICKGQQITFAIKDTTNVGYYQWDFGDGTDTIGISPVTHTFNISPSSGQTVVGLVLWSPDSTCTYTVNKNIYIYPVVADFSVNNGDSILCFNETVTYNNLSLNASTSTWNLGDGTTYTGVTPPPHTYAAPGTYHVTLNIGNTTLGCTDLIEKDIIINPLPNVIAPGADTCQGFSVQLNASGGVSYLWTPNTDLSSDTIPNPIASPSTSTTYTVQVTDSNGCIATLSVPVLIYEPPTPIIWDTSIVIGATVQLDVYIAPGYTYTWTPALGLSCTNCPNPVAQPLVNTVYNVTVADNAGCFSVISTYSFEILPVTSIDVPTAFTPNGDNNNDIIFVGGWGIKRLIEFKIYNRWGELVFETNDIHKGWDGYYKGQLQNVETYVYVAKVETWIEGKLLEKKGSFNLLR